MAGSFHVVCDSLGYLRESIAKELDLIDENKFNYLWVINWPMFEYSEGFGKWIAAHHPFTMLNEDDLKYLEEGEGPAPGPRPILRHRLKRERNRWWLNPYPRPEVQEEVFKALGYTKEAAQARFGFLIKALENGMPPEGGMAFGLDRWVSCWPTPTRSAA